MTTNVTPDFVQVQLSAAGISFAGAGAKVTLTNGHYNYAFTPGSPVKVLTSEWSRYLSLKSFEGQPILEVVPTVAVKPAPPTIEIVPGASHIDAPEQPAAQPTSKSKAAKNTADSEVK